MSHPSPDPLDPLLDRWGRAPLVQPLASAVRRRLASASREPSATTVREESFARPALAAVFLAACVLLGLFLAELRVSALHRERDAQLLESYRRLIDPLVNATPLLSETPHGGRS